MSSTHFNEMMSSYKWGDRWCNISMRKEGVQWNWVHVGEALEKDINCNVTRLATRLSRK
jgi:hypothetical protein